MGNNIDFMQDRYNDIVWYLLDNKELIIDLKPLIIASIIISSIAMALSIISIIQQRKLRKEIIEHLEQNKKINLD